MKNNNNKPFGQKLQNIRHSCAHLLAAAVLELFPDAKNAIGPSIENGFYQDFDLGAITISNVDFPKIENKMRQILKTWDDFQIKQVSVKQAKKDFSWNPYKLELIDALSTQGEKITETKQGSFLDLCKGGHAQNLAKEIGAFKLLSVAGAYWRGDEKNKMLTRIYGTCFPTQEELDQYLWQQEEAKKRDHKKIGAELDLFSFHEEGPGFIFWHPNGMRMRQPLIDFWNKMHDQAGYEEVSGPVVLTNDVWKISGHWDNYKDKMYFTSADDKDMALKPMNCPGMIIIYKNRPHSYRELPIRWRELGLVHRFEPSGTLNGLLRERAFRQDDAHIFCKEDQIEEEIKKVIELALAIYEPFHFKKMKVELSTRPEKSIGTAQMWEKSEKILQKVLEDFKFDYQINPGDGAFYGPKIDFHLTDSLGRQWQCGTIQLDFAMPERFKITYIDSNGKEQRPVMIHRAIFGSVHRFFGILIEHYAGAFPLWLSPVQIMIIPIAERHVKQANLVASKLRSNGFKVELDDRSQTMQAKIRDATLQKVPYMVIMGDKEKAGDAISLRTREGKDLGQKSLSQFIENLKTQIEEKN